MKAARPQGAAHLMRAAEHLSFGLLASAKAESGLDPRLVKAIAEEFDHKLEKAEEHWDGNDSVALTPMYEETLAGARHAFAEGAYRKALELVRAAEALAHVHVENTRHLGNGSQMARVSA